MNAGEIRGSCSIAGANRSDESSVLALRMIAAALHVDPAEEMDAGVDVAEHPQEFRITGNLGHALMKAFIQLQEMLDRRALLRLDAVIEIDVHGSEPFIGRPLAGELHNGDLEPEPSLVKIENLLHLQRPRKKAATGNQREQAFRDKPVHRLTQRGATDFPFASKLPLV